MKNFMVLSRYTLDDKPNDIYRLKISALQKKCTNIFPPTVVINIMLTFSFHWGLHSS